MADVFGSPPPLPHLTPHARTLITHLRHAIAPILANNVLPHFTDHSVSHSDRVTELLDELLNPLQSTGHRLRSQELIILYSTSYLHDIGLQLEDASETLTIGQLDLTLPWQELQEDERRDLLREHHHLVSAEVVNESPESSKPRIGLQLTTDYDASRIACLCEAHNLSLEDPADRERYVQLTQDGPNIRMALLSGLLRTADILDESRRRATRQKARTLLLPLQSQAHWWRHYYTESVTFDTPQRTICIWFDFPPDRLAEYDGVVPALQVPWIRAELQRHQPVFAKYGFVWSLTSYSNPKPYTNTEAMPDEVLDHMLAQLRAHHLRAETTQREVALRAYKEARPRISRRLQEHTAAQPDMAPAEYLLKTRSIADELWNIGSRRSAVFALAPVYKANAEHLSDDSRLEVGTRLLEMLLRDGTLELAQSWIRQLVVLARERSSDHSQAFLCLSLAAEWFTRRCAFDDAVEVIEHALQLADDPSQVSELEARLAELHFLHGHLRLAAGHDLSDVNGHA